jgi:hypothetical protein
VATERRNRRPEEEGSSRDILQYTRSDQQTGSAWEETPIFQQKPKATAGKSNRPTRGSMEPASRHPDPGPLSGTEFAPLPAPAKGKISTGEQAANSGRQLNYPEVGAAYAEIVTGRPVKGANPGVDSSAPLPTKDGASDEGKRRRDVITSCRAPREIKSPRGDKDVTVGAIAGGHFVTYPAAPKGQVGHWSPQPTVLSPCHYPLFRWKLHSGAPLSVHPVKCPDVWAARRLAPLRQAPKWIKPFRQRRGLTKPRCTYLGWNKWENS